jgi:hypothetical protein
MIDYLPHHIGRRALEHRHFHVVASTVEGSVESRRACTDDENLLSLYKSSSAWFSSGAGNIWRTFQCLAESCVLEWRIVPVKDSAPGILGMLGVPASPVATTWKAGVSAEESEHDKTTETRRTKWGVDNLRGSLPARSIMTSQTRLLSLYTEEETLLEVQTFRSRLSA